MPFDATGTMVVRPEWRLSKTHTAADS